MVVVLHCRVHLFEEYTVEVGGCDCEVVVKRVAIVAEELLS